MFCTNNMLLKKVNESNGKLIAITEKWSISLNYLGIIIGYLYSFVFLLSDVKSFVKMTKKRNEISLRDESKPYFK